MQKEFMINDPILRLWQWIQKGFGPLFQILIVLHEIYEIRIPTAA